MRKIGIGLVGLNFGTYILENMLVAGKGAKFFSLKAVCDQDSDKAEACAAEHGCLAYDDLDAMLKNDEVEVVALITGPNGRAELIRKIIRAGKDVMTTKPFERDPEAAEAVLAEARKLGRIVYLNSPAPVMNRDFETIRKWEKKYSLGRLVAGHHECWYKSVEEANGSWYDDPKQCPAAPVLRLGIYGINDFVQFFGEPLEVQVMETRLFTGRPTPDLARMSIKFKNGAIVDTLDGWVCQPGRGAQSLILYYENGTVYRNPPLLPGRVEGALDAGTYLCVVTADCEDGSPKEMIRLEPDDLSSFYAWEVFHKVVLTRERPVQETPDRAIVNAIRILDAMARAAAKGGTAKV